jgi:hypothetical protein
MFSFDRLVLRGSSAKLCYLFPSGLVLMVRGFALMVYFLGVSGFISATCE